MIHTFNHMFQTKTANQTIKDQNLLVRMSNKEQNHLARMMIRNNQQAIPMDDCITATKTKRRLMQESLKHQAEMHSKIDQKFANTTKDIQRNTTYKLQIEKTIKQAHNQFKSDNISRN